MKKVIFCIYGSQERLIDIIKENDGNELVFVQLDAWLERLPIAGCVTLKGYRDYLSREDCIKIDKDAADFSRSWYLVSGEDITRYGNYPLGEITRIAMYTLFIEIFKNILVVEKVLEKEAPQEAIIFDNSDILGKILKTSLSHLDVKIHVVNIPPQKRKQITFPRAASYKFKQGVFHRIRFFMQYSVWFLINKWPWFNEDRQPLKRLRVYFDPYVGYYTLIERLFGGINYEVLLARPTLSDIRHIKFLKSAFKNKVSFLDQDNCMYQLSNVVIEEAETFPNQCWQRVKNNQEFLRQFKWGKVNFQDIMVNELRNNYFVQFSYLIKELNFAEKFLTRHKIDMMLIPWDDGVLHKSFAAAAKKFGIHTKRYQHGIFINCPHLPVMPCSDKIIVWGNMGKDFYLKRGIAIEKLELCGNPIRELLDKKKTKIDKIKLSNKLGLDPEKKIVLYADTDFADITAFDHPYDSSRVLVKLIRAARMIPETQFLIKFHHGDIIRGCYKEKMRLIESLGASNVYVFADYNIYSLLLISDMVITEFSTVGLEGMIADKPAIILKLRNGYMDDLSPYEDSMGLMVVREEDQIKPTIERIFDDKELQKELIIKQKEFLEYATGRGKCDR